MPWMGDGAHSFEIHFVTCTAKLANIMSREFFARATITTRHFDIYMSFLLSSGNL